MSHTPDSAPPGAGDAIPGSARRDARIQYVLYLLPIAAFFHILGWITDRGGIYYTRWTAARSWDPGFFLGVEADLAVNWLLWFCLILYLPFCKHRRAVAALLTLVTVSHFFHLPERVPNHFIVLAVPIPLVALCRPSSGSDTPVIIPLLRCLLVITYLFAVLQKINPVYFSPESPAVNLLSGTLTNLGFSSSTALWPAAPLAGLGCEIAIPILLLVRKWRPYGFYLGLLFHGLIAATGAADYSAIILMVYPVFFERDEARNVAELFRKPKIAQFVAALLIGFAATFVCYFPIDLSDITTTNNIQTRETFPFVAVLVGLHLYTAIVLLPWLRGDIAPGPPVRQHWPFSAKLAIWTFATAYVLNCMSPYIGLKYYYSQAMFSGLDKQGTNHYFIPACKIFDTRRYVSVLRFEAGPVSLGDPQSDYAPLRRFARRAKKQDVSENLLSSIIASACRHPDLRPIRLSYVRVDEPGVVQSVKDACKEPTELASPHPFNLYPNFIDRASGPPAGTSRP